MQTLTKTLLAIIVGISSFVATTIYSATSSDVKTPQASIIETDKTITNQTQESEKQAVLETLKALFPGQVPEKISPAVFPDWLEAIYGTQVLYVSNDGRYVISGDIYDMSKEINLTEQTRTQQRRKIMQSMSTDDMIIFKPEKTKYIVTVFSDIDCAYCRKMHSQIDDYLAAGIEFRYLMYPRSGMYTESYYKAVSVWCSDDRQKSLTAAKKGIVIENKNCKNPVRHNIQLADAMGITGTPAILFASGEIIPGYLPPKDLLDALENTHPENL